jgi:hypothetical protein
MYKTFNPGDDNNFTVTSNALLNIDLHPMEKEFPLVTEELNFDGFLKEPPPEKKKQYLNISENIFNNRRNFNTNKKKKLLPTQDDNNNMLIMPYIKQLKSKNKSKKVKIRNVKNYTKLKFDKLYGTTQKFMLNLKKIKKENDLTLQEHQNKLLSASTNLSRDNVLKLFSDLKAIRITTEQIKPLPPINYKSLYDHSLREAEMKRNRYIMRNFNKLHKTKDDYELEQEEIAKTRFGRVVKENPAMYKIYQILPEHVVDAIYKKKKNKA